MSRIGVRGLIANVSGGLSLQFVYTQTRGVVNVTTRTLTGAQKWMKLYIKEAAKMDCVEWRAVLGQVIGSS